MKTKTNQKDFLTLDEVKAIGLNYRIYTEDESVYIYETNKGETLVEDGVKLCENVYECHWYAKGVHEYEIEDKGTGFTLKENDVILCENVYLCHWYSKGVYKYKKTGDSVWVQVGF